MLKNCEAWEIEDSDGRVVVNLYAGAKDENPTGHISMCTTDAEEFMKDLQEAIEYAKE